MKTWLRNLLLGNPQSQWVVLGLQAPQRQIQVQLQGVALHPPLDVTRNTVVAALRPLTFALSFAKKQIQQSEIEQSNLSLHFREVPSNRLLGWIKLTLSRVIEQGEYLIFLFIPTAHANYCLPRMRLYLQYLNEWRQQRKQKKNAFNFSMPAHELRALLVFYICPRPVVLVSVKHEGKSNLFPMDLIGPTDSPYFLMALRLTSPAVQLMVQSKQMALALVPVEMQSNVYELGKHHKQEQISLESLPFALLPSPLFHLPVPAPSLGVCEVIVIDHYEIGSHMLFVTQIQAEVGWRVGEQMFHIPGLYQQYRLGNTSHQSSR